MTGLNTLKMNNYSLSALIITAPALKVSFVSKGDGMKNKKCSWPNSLYGNCLNSSNEHKV